MGSDYGEELEVRGKKIRVGNVELENEFSSEELGIATVEFEKVVEEMNCVQRMGRANKVRRGRELGRLQHGDRGFQRCEVGG